MDRQLLQWLVASRSEGMDVFFRAVTWLGSLAVLIPWVIVAMLVLIVCKRAREARFLGASLAGTVVMVHASKLIVARPRPRLFEALTAMPWDQSFPSAHAAQVAAVMLASVLIARRLSSLRFGLFAALALLLVTLVAISRIYLQVHYPSDVLTGVLASGLWVAGLAQLMLRSKGDA